MSVLFEDFWQDRKPGSVEKYGFFGKKGFLKFLKSARI